MKPDIGAGANGAARIDTEDELLSFYSELPSEPYVMEEFLSGDIHTYDAVIGPDCEPLFESTCTYPPVIDSVLNDENIHFYTSADIPQQLRELGRKTVKAFGADKRFVHFEFIRLTEDHDGIRYICAYAARKDGHVFTHSHDEIMERYGGDIVLQEEMPPIDWPAMGRYVYMARFKEKEEMERFFDFVLN